MTFEDYAESNRRAWNQVAPIHQRARKIDLRQEVQGADFNDLEEVEKELLLQIGVQGKQVAQLCCNNGRELISIVRMGAQYGLGFDISDEVISEARELSELAGTNCDFIRTDVLDIGADNFDRFDLVFISIGALTWLHKLDRLFDIASGLLVPGGHLLIHEMHPFLDMLATKLDDEYDPENELKIAYSYFSQESWIDEQGLDYIGDTTYDSLPSISFPHTLSDIISAIIASGLSITHFREYPQDISEGAASRPQLRPLLIGLSGYLLFAGLGLIGRKLTLAFHLMSIVGFVLPLVWGRLTGRWHEMGFTRHNWRQALLWGLGAGVVTSIIGVTTMRSPGLAPSLGLQLIIGVPFALLLASPFQEFFFRGWLQTRLEAGLGRTGGLLLGTGLFLLWHYLAPFASTPGFGYPLNTVAGFLGTMVSGLIFGYVFQRTRSILAPWLAHSMAHIAFAAAGAVVFIDVFQWLGVG